ncbi:flavin-containing monooxygenase [Williamsia limnetica]|nr:NAD(P)/FAD-dependent oxidoreductase [Williamsia limnetica]
MTHSPSTADAKRRPTEIVDVVVVGAGFGGLYALKRIRDAGMSVRVFEAGSGVGGTWFWNRYPGARCDIESVDYSYSFSEDLQIDWNWTEKYAKQSEILAYLNHVADRFDLRGDIVLNTRVLSAHFDEAGAMWSVTTSDGRTVSATYCVMASGVLSSIKEPDFPGLADFSGDVYQTSRWPDGGVDFSGRRVAVIGTGSTGVQAIPLIAKQAAQLTVFQRTPNFSVPARNRPLAAGELDQVRATYAERRQSARMSLAGFPEVPSPGRAVDHTPEQRQEIYEAAWAAGGGPRLLRAFSDIGTSPEANASAADFIRSKIAEIVKDPDTADRLSPKTYPLGTKRICVDTNYFDTYNRPNVTLVDVMADPIVEFSPTGLRTTGAEYDFDAVVLALGFDAVTGALMEIDIKGRDGEKLTDRWKHGPRSYLGVAVSGFPNLFTVTGPGSPSVLGNVVTSIEQHVDFITDCIEFANRKGHDIIEAADAAEDSWVRHVAEKASESLISTSTTSWYRGANIPGKPLVVLPYTGGVGTFREICERIARNDFEGFLFGAAKDSLDDLADDTVAEARQWR